MSILVIIEGNIDFSRNLEMGFGFGKKKNENLGYGQNFRKMSIWVKIWKFVDLGQNL